MRPGEAAACLVRLLINSRTQTKILKFTYTLCVGCLSPFFRCHPSLFLLSLLLKEYSLLPLLGVLRVAKEIRAVYPDQTSMRSHLCVKSSPCKELFLLGSWQLSPVIYKGRASALPASSQGGSVPFPRTSIQSSHIKHPQRKQRRFTQAFCCG